MGWNEPVARDQEIRSLYQLRSLCVCPGRESNSLEPKDWGARVHLILTLAVYLIAVLEVKDTIKKS